MTRTSGGAKVTLWLTSGAVVLSLGCAPGVQYVAPGSGMPQKGAPGLRAQSLGATATTYAVVLAPGDEVVSGLTQYAEKEHLSASHLTAIGGFQSCVLAWFDKSRNEFRKIVIDDQVEVLSMVGDVALVKGKPVVHAHIVVGFPDGTTRGGHLLEAVVWPTLEVFLVEGQGPLVKVHQDATGIDVMTPSAKPESGAPGGS